MPNFANYVVSIPVLLAGGNYPVHVLQCFDFYCTVNAHEIDMVQLKNKPEDHPLQYDAGNS